MKDGKKVAQCLYDRVQVDWAVNRTPAIPVRDFTSLLCAWAWQSRGALERVRATRLNGAVECSYRDGQKPLARTLPKIRLRIHPGLRS